MSDPRILGLICCAFAALTAFSLYHGLSQLRAARRAGHAQRWYKNLSLLTGLEYGLLAFVFFLRVVTVQGLIAPGIGFMVGPLYIILLVPACLLAGLLIYRALTNMRLIGIANRPTATRAALPLSPEEPSQVKTPEQVRNQRERRKKAAVARRRQAGKA